MPNKRLSLRKSVRPMCITRPLSIGAHYRRSPTLRERWSLAETAISTGYSHTGKGFGQQLIWGARMQAIRGNQKNNMKRTFATVLSLFSLLITALPAFAGIVSLNGQTGNMQTLATTTGASTMHMQIISSANTHTFQWDNTPWRVDQGGTGQTSFTSGELIYGNGTSALNSTAGGTLGYVLQFNGTFPTWVATSSLGLVTPPAGSNGEIQFNNNGVFGADAQLKWSPLNFGAPTLILPRIAGRVFFDQFASSTPAQIYLAPGVDFAGHSNGGNLTLSGGAGHGAATNRSGGAFLYSGDVDNGAAPSINLAPLECSSGACSGGLVEILLAGGPGLNGKLAIEGQDGVHGEVDLDINSIFSTTRNFSFPDASGTFGLLEANQKWTGANTFSRGAVGTTTVNFGTMGSTTSHVCFNTKNTDGADISFYFVGTSMVVANNACQ